MAGRRLAEGIVVLLLLVVVGSLLLGNFLGQPILLSYVETKSMKPTLDPGDGFIAIPASLAGPIEPGDVITFRAETLHGGGLTTHRVVEETDRGFITKGDNNPFTDQDNEEPPVRRGQIVAEALQIGGSVVVIPHLGTVVETLQGVLGVFAGAVSEIQRQAAILTGSRAFLGQQGIAYLLFGFGMLAYVVSLVFGGKTESRDRSPTSRTEGVNATLIVLGLAFLMVASVTTAMVIPSGGETFRVVSSDNDAPGPSVIEKGTSEQTSYTVTNGGVVPMVVYIGSGSSGLSVTPTELSLSGGETANATVTLSAPDETGFYPQYLNAHWYLGVLPRGVIRGLYDVHPWLPILVIDALVGIVSGLVGFAVLGTGRVRFDSRETWIEAKVRRLLRKR